MANRNGNPPSEGQRRKEDYKAYTERDRDDGWPYSDEPGPEDERLQGNRPYAAEKEQSVQRDAEREGWHVEDAPLKGGKQDMARSPVQGEVVHLTDTGNKTPERIGWTLAGAMLAPVDNYFMRLRRKINYLERPIPTRSNAGRLWSGYHAYDPKRVLQMLEIFRVYTNYIRTKDGKTTPATKMGLAKGSVRFEDVIYWMPRNP